MIAAYMVPIGLQAIAMLVDEGWFHRRRGLPRWERIGHPLDTLTIAACLGWLLIAKPDETSAIPVYLGLAIGSTLFVTKDEFIHARLCSSAEHWLHAVLFTLHPIVLAAAAALWWSGQRAILIAQFAATLGFCAYQIVYWNVVRTARRTRHTDPSIDNAWYGQLGDRWYDAEDTPIALLRAEARHRNPWIRDQITRALGSRPCRVLDVGCGAGLLANDLAAHGHHVVGIDSCAASLAIAHSRDATRSVEYQIGDAYALPYPDASFDVVCAMDLLEHVEHPERVIAEASRVLGPSGMLFFHTFNRSWLAYLIVIKAVEWFVANTPRDLHVLRLFIRPDELTAMCRAHGLTPVELRGSRPRFGWPLWRMVLTGTVGADFAFTFSRSVRLGYTGWARRDSVGQPAHELCAGHADQHDDRTRR
jgi:2-polyprenyl-6-hydroxyphenyl methylase / 3-demethylubiquinone-9 3-methyltransferase